MFKPTTGALCFSILPASNLLITSPAITPILSSVFSIMFSINVVLPEPIAPTKSTQKMFFSSNAEYQNGEEEI